MVCLHYTTGCTSCILQTPCNVVSCFSLTLVFHFGRCPSTPTCICSWCRWRTFLLMKLWDGLRWCSEVDMHVGAGVGTGCQYACMCDVYYACDTASAGTSYGPVCTSLWNFAPNSDLQNFVTAYRSSKRVINLAEKGRRSERDKLGRRRSTSKKLMIPPSSDARSL